MMFKMAALSYSWSKLPTDSGYLTYISSVKGTLNVNYFNAMTKKRINFKIMIGE